MINRLINIEGIDCSGKSTLARMLANKLTTADKAWAFEHEPNFSSQEADLLNFSTMDPWRREYYFMKDRMNHQFLLRNHNIVLDRYILTGLAYAYTYSPKVIDMMKSIYSMPNEFVRPDIIVFIDIEPEDALKFNDLKKGTPEYSTSITLESLTKVRDNFKLFFPLMQEWEIPLAIVKPTIGDLNKTLDSIHTFVKPHI